MSEAHDNEAPEEQASPAAQPQEPPVESLLGLRDYLAVAPRRSSASVTIAAHAAMQRWMHQHGYDVNGFYTMEQWQACYDEAMASTG
jgi:hypothetical protein